MNSKKYIFPIEGLHCASCAARAEKVIRACDGVMEAAINLPSNEVAIEYDVDKITAEELANVVGKAGYKLVVEVYSHEEMERKKLSDYRRLRCETLWAVVLSVPLFVIGMFFISMPYGSEISALLSSVILFYFGRGFFVRTYKQLKSGRVTMDTLVTLSTSVAYIFSLTNMIFPEFWVSRGIEPHVYFEAAGMIVAFILVGKLLEVRAKNSTTSEIKSLIGLQPRTALVEVDGKQREIAISSVHIGDIVVVRSGEKIAVDGEVIDGSSFVDESMFNGEPMPQLKNHGAKVYAGTINQNGTFRFSATKVGSLTLLSQIIAMVEQAQKSKAPIQNIVDKIASVFVPTIIAVAVLSLLAWMVFDPVDGFTHGMMAFVTVLVIACPCALGLATPTAIMVGVGAGARRGILIKDALSLELAKNVNAVVLDKTGTITEGKPTVVDEVWCKENTELRNILYTIENRSTHPIAQSIVENLKDSQILPIENFENIIGFGVQVEYKGIRYFAGNREFAKSFGVEVDSFSSGVGSEVFFGIKHELVAKFTVADKVKESSIKAIESLFNRGIEVYMLTGDNQLTSSQVASQVGISSYKAEVLPAEKLEFIKSLQAQGKTVAMVGDGVNDSAALAQSDLSIAMGTGSDVAMDVACITIVSDDLRKIEEAIVLSKQTVKTIRQNLFWAFIFNIVGVPIAAGVLYPLFGVMLSPMIASAAMALSSVSVITNSLRIKREINSKLIII